MTDANTPTLPSDRYVQRSSHQPPPWHVRAERQRQAQHRLDVAAAYRGARLLHEAQARSGGAR